MLKERDVQIMRELAKKYAEIAALPVHAEKRKLWQDNNEFRAARPMVLIDQICWGEINTDGSLDAQCEDPYWRGVEAETRRKLYCWEHMPVDMVIHPYFIIPKPIHNTGWGLGVDEDVVHMDKNSGAASHRYRNQLQEWEDIEKIKMPEITLDVAKMAEIREQADVIFDGIIPYRFDGQNLQLGIWDSISHWMGVENCYIELIERPEFIHAIMERLTQGLLYQIETINRLGVYDVASGMVHCNHTFLDNVPGKNADPEFGTTMDGWGFGQAQLFTSVSPEITKEFEVEYMKRVHPHFGAIYYGCCERLDDRLDVLAELDNVRKISCSPWSDREHFAECLPERRVMSIKPNPAFLATDSFNEDIVRRDLRSYVDIARRYNRNIEFILKDISTIRYDQPRLWRWAEIAMEEAQR